jgi:hypothetical protein
MGIRRGVVKASFRRPILRVGQPLRVGSRPGGPGALRDQPFGPRAAPFAGLSSFTTGTSAGWWRAWPSSPQRCLVDADRAVERPKLEIDEITGPRIQNERSALLIRVVKRRAERRRLGGCRSLRPPSPRRARTTLKRPRDTRRRIASAPSRSLEHPSSAGGRRPRTPVHARTVRSRCDRGYRCLVWR